MRCHFGKVLCAALLIAVPAEAVECSPQSLVPKATACLTGIAIAGERRIALFSDNDISISKEAGADIQGWRVVAVDAQSVTMERNGTRQVLSLGEPSTAPKRSAIAHKADTTLHDVSPRNAGKADSIGVSGKQDVFSISTHLPPVKDY